jgi:hypothetical protein
MRITKGRAVAVAAVVAVIGLGAAGAANADSQAPAPEASRDATSSSIPNTQGAVKNWHLGKGVVYGDNLGPGMVAWFTGGPYNNSVRSDTIIDKQVQEKDLADAVASKLNATKGQITGLESDGPYPGSTKLQDHPGNGANSTEKVPADGKSHTVWVQCADGKSALGGGYRVGADQGDAVASKLQVTASEPTQIKDGKVVYEPIAGDAAGSVEPNGWLVEVINAGTVDATVRPFVTCAKVAK